MEPEPEEIAAAALGITVEELAEYKQAFEAFDTDKDGLLTNRELLKVMKYVGVTVTEAELNDMIDIMDPEKTGSFNLETYLPMVVKKVPTAFSEEKLLEAFRVCDIDKNGFISLADLQVVILFLGVKLTDADLEEMIQEADMDGDGQVNFEEFAYIMGLKLE